MKTCTKCGVCKPADLAHFYANGNNRGGLDGYCKPCRRWCSANRPARAKRNTQLKGTYGIDHAEYDVMLKAQGYACAICGGPPKGKAWLSVDHDAETAVVRGLLCDPCNRAIGMLAHDSGRIRAAAAYLDRAPSGS